MKIFRQFSDRPGSQEDVKKLVNTFKTLHCKLFEKECHTNLTIDEIQDVICRFTKDPSIISRILIVMSHGNKYELMDTNDICYDYKSVIIDAFNVKNAPHLTNVLKLIMIQACRYIFFKHIPLKKYFNLYYNFSHEFSKIISLIKGRR